MSPPSQSLRPLTRDQRFRPFGTGIHVATGSAHFMGIPIWNSTAVIELASPGGLLVWNLITLTDALRASLRELEKSTGRTVTTLLAPMDYHHRALRQWQEAYPEAATWLVSERIVDQQPGVRGEVIEGDRPVVPGAESELALLRSRGCRAPVIERSPRWKDAPRSEWFVFHRPSRSLLVGDMLFLQDAPSWLERRLLKRRSGFSYNVPGFRVSDRPEHDLFARDVLKWDFDQAITAHATATAHGGEYIRGELEAAFRM